ncbi:MAG: glutathione S-transferase family protein, partial [Deltaproteobacteria bacterium]|nr:glutathione S-transferase family protein [Deltaproteobacteria bacterium]
MSFTLYFVPQTRATRPRWLLEELAVPYELVQLDPAKGETR